MAKSASTIATNIATNIQSADPSCDVTKGPYYDQVIVPPATELASVAQETERVGTLYSRLVDTSNLLNATEIDALGRALNVTTPVGKQATVLLTFYATAKPNGTISIPVGTAVATTDGSYIFTTTQAISGITSANISSYYDSTSGRYLISAMATAVSEGTGYNLPAYRITRLLTTLTGIAGVYNSAASTGGKQATTSSDYLTQVQAAFYGRDTGSISGLKVELQRRGVTAQMLFVGPDERSAFFRPVLGSALDIYLSDTDETSADESIDALGKTTFTLSKQPVLSVTSVYINGTLLDSSYWSVSYDTSLAYAKSTSATTTVTLTTTTSTTDTVRVRYTYAKSVYDLQQSLDDQDLMGADLLPRILRPLNVNISAQINCPTNLLATIKSALQTYVTAAFLERIDPSDVYTYLRTSYSDIKQLKWTKFDRLGFTGVTPIDVPHGLQPTFSSASDFSVTLARS